MSVSRIATIIFVLSVWSLPNGWGQHDLHRNATRLLAKGGSNIDKAIQQLKKKEKDVESLYLLMVAHSLKKDIDTALDYAKQAINAGLPFARIQAGPRTALAPLYASQGYKDWAAKKEQILIHGPMLGNMTDSSVDIWVRTAKAAKVEVRVIGGKKIESKPVQTSKKTDFTAVARLEGLSSDTWYHYQVFVDGKPAGDRSYFRPNHVKGKPSQFRIAFGGGAGYVPKWERMWDLIAKSKSRAVLMLGDNVYIDDPKHLITQQYCYYRRQSRPEWRRLTSKIPIYSIYDDHDFGTNDCVPGPDIEKPTWKREVWNVFRQNWANPGYGGGQKQPGCWYDFHISDVHFILIDGRYYRDLKGGSMLGPVQKAWVKKTLKESKAKIKVLASDVPWTPGVKPGSRDTWDGFAKEREELFSFIQKQKIDGVLLIAADRHRSDIRKIKRESGYDFVEFQSSKLTNRHTHKVVKTPGLVFGYNKKCSFGQMDFDTTKKDPTITMKIISIDGEEIYSMKIALSELSHQVKR